MMRQLKLLGKFRSVKPCKNPNPNPNKLFGSELGSSAESCSSKSSKKQCSWCVYLILSSNYPIKTYVGVTTDFSRRLKQHNGELKGGAKASRAGRPWVCACIIRGFGNQSQACEFESKWKISSRKLSRRKKADDNAKEEDDGRRLLLQHRNKALQKVKQSSDWTRLEIDWLKRKVPWKNGNTLCVPS